MHIRVRNPTPPVAFDTATILSAPLTEREMILATLSTQPIHCCHTYAWMMVILHGYPLLGRSPCAKRAGSWHHQIARINLRCRPAVCPMDEMRSSVTIWTLPVRPSRVATLSHVSRTCPSLLLIGRCRRSAGSTQKRSPMNSPVSVLTRTAFSPNPWTLQRVCPKSTHHTVAPSSR